MATLQRLWIDPRARRIFRFGVSGVIATAVHVTVATVLIRSLAMLPALANGCAFIVANLVSYTLSVRWTFADVAAARPHGVQLPRFFAASLAGLAASMAIAAVADWLGLHYAVGIAAVVCMVPLLTFTLHSRWTFR